MKPIQIYRAKDSKEKYYKKKGNCFDLPMRILLVGKSQFSGKSSFLLNMLCQDDKRLYKDDFDEIYIFSGSLTTDNKVKTIILQHDIPDENCYDTFDNDMLDAIFDLTKEEYEIAISEGSKPKNVLVILDDVGFDASMKKDGSINKCFCNGRHINLSICCVGQRYTQFHTTQRENATGIIAWSCSDKQLDLISDDHNQLGDKKIFKSMFRKVTEDPFSAMIISYSNPKESRYMNLNFEPVGPCGKVKNKGCDCL